MEPVVSVDPGSCPTDDLGVPFAAASAVLAGGREVGPEGLGFKGLPTCVATAAAGGVRCWATLSADVAPSSCATMSRRRHTSSATPRRNACKGGVLWVWAFYGTCQ